MKTQQREEELVHLYPEHGVAVLNKAFTSDPRLRCTSQGARVIKQIIEKLSKQGFKRLSAPPHLDGRDTKLIRFFEGLGFQKRGEMYAFERNLQEHLPALGKIPDPRIEVTNMEKVCIDKLHKAMDDAFVASITQRSPLTIEELASRIENSLKQASFQASLDKKVISFVLVSAKSNKTAHLDYQGTVPEHRRKGLGFHLLCRSMTTLKDLGFQKLIAKQVLPESKAEMSLLQKAGFRFSHSQFNLIVRLPSETK